MAQKSRIDTDLPDDVRVEFRQLLASGRLTIDTLLEWLRQRDYDISRSSVGRYAKNFDLVADSMRETRELTDALVTDLGASASQGRQGRLLVEMVQGMLLKFMFKLKAEKGELDTKEFMQLSKSLSDLGRALRLNQDFEAEIREEERKRMENAVNQVEKQAADAVMTPEEALAKVRALYRGD